MAQVREPDVDDVPYVDHEAVQETVRLSRARRRARTEHKRRGRRAAIRFWVVLVLLVAVCAIIAGTVWHEIQRLFGL